LVFVLFYSPALKCFIADKLYKHCIKTVCA